MRPVSIAGFVLAAAGLFLLIKGVSYTQETSVFKLGEIEARVKQDRRVPEWLGGLSLGAGIVLVVVGLRKR
jgi:hypothetical protein